MTWDGRDRADQVGRMTETAVQQQAGVQVQQQEEPTTGALAEPCRLCLLNASSIEFKSRTLSFSVRTVWFFHASAYKSPSSNCLALADRREAALLSSKLVIGLLKFSTWANELII